MKPNGSHLTELPEGKDLPSEKRKMGLDDLPSVLLSIQAFKAANPGIGWTLESYVDEDGRLNWRAIAYSEYVKKHGETKLEDYY